MESSMEVDGSEHGHGGGQNSSSLTTTGDDQSVQNPDMMEPIIQRPLRVSVEGALHPLGDDHHSGYLYHADDVGLPPTLDLPDEFYEPRKSDVDTVWRGLQAQRKDLEDAPLLTAKYRSQYHEDGILRNLRENPVSLLRIRFPNRYVLQGTFRGVDTLQAVLNFVKIYLIHPDINFYLCKQPLSRAFLSHRSVEHSLCFETHVIPSLPAGFSKLTSPPRLVLSNSDKRLVEQGLVGCTVMYFGCRDSENTTGFLKPELYTQVSCPQAVFRISRNLLEKKQRMDPASLNANPHEGQDSEQTQGQGQGTTSAAGPSRRGGGGAAGSSRAVPKWFKTGRN